MSNFFAALEVDSDEEEAPQPRALKVSSLGGAPSTKDKRRQDHTKKETRNTKSGRGGRGGRAPSREGKRAYDRRSGTGRGKEIKKGGGGKRNWGSDKNDAKQAEGTIVEGDESEPRKVEEETPYVEEEEEEREPEIETVSYEEYMANKAKSDSQAFQPLKERKVQNEFAKVEAKKKTVTEDFLVMGEGKKDRKRGKNSKKQAIDLGFRVKSSDDPVDRKRDGGGVAVVEAAEVAEMAEEAVEMDVEEEAAPDEAEAVEETVEEEDVAEDGRPINW
eukprot:CAMPEP_0194049342 /NCGR_PEP_ID=MMETSP0009_2-20130614/30408_1 /TAXON_ID=210454 /ORGANISM="Grammatophora oceanica, Strain CCMP 410" /LENGTH=274 /DNA_ID=CAMNT_0038695469 /DNA_START=52 /DNA_END=874 /DNA_ORIENTATION=+